MRYRLLGRSGLRVSELALGTMTFGNEQWGAAEPEAAQLYALFRDAGGNFIDTANEMYAEGRSEEILGRLLSGHRDEVVLSTKYSFYPPRRRPGPEHSRQPPQEPAALRRGQSAATEHRSYRSALDALLGSGHSRGGSDARSG